MIAEKHVDTGAEMHRSRKRKRASKQKSRQVAKQRSRNNKNSSIQRKYLNLLKRNLKSIALHKKGLRQKHGPKIKPQMYV